MLAQLVELPAWLELQARLDQALRLVSYFSFLSSLCSALAASAASSLLTGILPRHTPAGRVLSLLSPSLGQCLCGWTGSYCHQGSAGVWSEWWHCGASTCISFHHQKPRAEGTHPNDPESSRGWGGRYLKDITKVILSPEKTLS